MAYYTKVSGHIVNQGDILYPVKVKDWIPWWADEDSYPIVVMTPICDISQERADYHRFCILQPFPILLYKVGQLASLTRQHWDGAIKLGKDKSRSIKDKLTNGVSNTWPRYHFLPSEKDVFETNYIVDFEVVVTAPRDELRPELRHTSLVSPYREELIHRYSHHVMRIGTKDVSSSFVSTVVDSCIDVSGLKVA